MRLGHLLFSFSGRITRVQYWLGGLMVSFGGAVLMFVGMIFTSAGAGGKGGGDVIAFGLMLIPIIVLMSWCALAVQVKRLHDRGRSGWFSALPAGFSLLSTLLVLSAATAANPMAGVGMALPLGGIGLLINLWLFIELGFLAGADGPSKYDGSAETPRARAPVAPAEPSVAQSGLGGAEAAMERAIADREVGEARGPPALRHVGATRVFAGAGPVGPSFGRRVRG
jgi:uncharacterized membrane protein YhaH (DUF805 family)